MLTLHEYLKKAGTTQYDYDCVVADACQNMEGSWLWEGPMADALQQQDVVEALQHLEWCCYAIVSDLVEQGDEEVDLDQPIWSINILKDVALWFKDNDREQWADQLDKALLFEYIKENA
jgi:hypothetical protein